MVERLGHLRDKGLLSAEEFEGKKRELLTRI
ncbi:SHOCT domain-containing protein [Microvirga sp. Marseille-Q2068]|uniref:SHOCT domain-containing protein n=2 Tax=Microvirga mediterraneensis TaxID=2754695 RepID=A0A838BSX6_9HYPH|nr:SHOCT domain-containing protein [Microvirga mediterraneensis]